MKTEDKTKHEYITQHISQHELLYFCQCHGVGFLRAMQMMEPEALAYIPDNANGGFTVVKKAKRNVLLNPAFFFVAFFVALIAGCILL